MTTPKDKERSKLGIPAMPVSERGVTSSDVFISPEGLIFKVRKIMRGVVKVKRGSREIWLQDLQTAAQHGWIHRAYVGRLSKRKA